MTYELLSEVNSPSDIKCMNIAQLTQLCAEIRQYMIECCAVNPGHLGSSLGAVEIMVGLHYVYDSPEDKLVFDVGHQAYAHKIITGRRDAFRHNRTKDGISGFPKRSESEYDAFGTGHSSTSVSAALGFAEAARQQGLKQKIVALIGDGSLTGGLAFEGLNNAGASKADMLVILNDNNISIDNNIGALHNYLLHITTDPTYNKVKNHVWNTVGDGFFRKIIQRFVVKTKTSLVRKSGGDLFEALGFRYFGPIDGNDLETFIKTLKKLKDMKGPKILHVITKKGKGYAPAEKNQTVWHAPGMFDPETGERLKSSGDASRYQDVFGQVLLELAESDPRVVGITPAMASGCGMNILAKKMPERFYDVGIEEEHAVTFSAGLAAGGMKPFCNIYSSFSQRAYDQIIHDVALQELGVVLCFDRSGIVGEDGATHHGCYDIAAYRSIPGIIISAPKDEIELKNLMYTATRTEKHPFIIRYPRGNGEGLDWQNEAFSVLPVGKGEKMMEGTDVAVIAAGPVANNAFEAAQTMAHQYGWNPTIYNIRYIKPIDEELLTEACSRHSKIITVEDGCIKGGLFGAVSEFCAKLEESPQVTGLGIPDRYISQGTQEELKAECGIDTKGILKVLTDEMKKNHKKD